MQKNLVNGQTLTCYRAGAGIILRIIPLPASECPVYLIHLTLAEALSLRQCIAANSKRMKQSFARTKSPNPEAVPPLGTPSEPPPSPAA